MRFIRDRQRPDFFEINQLATLNKDDLSNTERIRSIRTNIEANTNDGEKLQLIAIASPSTDKGGSIFAADLAVTYAKSDKKTLLVDCNLQYPSHYTCFDVKQLPGFSDLINDNQGPKDLAQQTQINGLRVLTSGLQSNNSPELFDSESFRQVIDGLRHDNDVILLNSPAINETVDARILATVADGVVIVVHENQTSKVEILKAIRQLELVKANILGVVYLQENI